VTDLVAQPSDSMRASDADRDRVLKLLATATSDGRLTMDEHNDLITKTLHARTLGELVVITHDLAPAPSADPAPAPSPGPPSRRGLFAVFGARSRKGVWQVPTELRASAIFGAIELDFRDAQFDGPEVLIIANTIFGAVELTVPEWVRVEDEGHVIFGARDFHDSKGPSPAGQRPTVTVRLRGLTVFGAVEVRRKGTKAPRDPDAVRGPGAHLGGPESELTGQTD
jgi:Domain of unknown function (DUF1707)/Cell wall-active antibiotics response 4TMS YvqF